MKKKEFTLRYQFAQSMIREERAKGTPQHFYPYLIVGCVTATTGKRKEESFTASQLRALFDLCREETD